MEREESLMALIAKCLGLLAGLGVFLLLGWSLQPYYKDLLQGLESLGSWGPLLFILIYILATLLLLPGSVLTLGGGAVFGLLKGFIYVSLASVMGACLAFLIGRYLARGWVEKKLERNPKFKAIDEAIANEGWKIVLLTRLSPLFPFNLLNYAYGLTQVSFWHYFLLSWLGMIPVTLMYVYLGSLAGSMARLDSGQAPTTPAQWALRIVGLLATVTVTVYITRIAGRALQTKVEPEA